MHVGQGGELEDDRLGAPGQTGESGGENEGDQLVVIDFVAERDGAPLVFANRLQHLSERRTNRTEDQQETEDENGENDEVERHRVVEREDPEHDAARDRLDAVLAAGERRLHAEEEQHLRQRA